MMRRHWLLYVTIVVVCLPGIAKAETGVTNDTIKIGSVYAVTGANAQYGLARTSTKMAFDEINRKGGINGRKIELVIEDGACDRAKSVSAVKKLVHSDQVFALFGGVCSTAVKAATQSTIEAKVPWFVLSTAAQNIMDRVFAVFPRLRERLPQLAGTLSGGEQQMLAIGRALMARPRLLVLDEPSLGLAPRLVEEIVSTIASINAGGTTVLLIEQNARIALEVARFGLVLEPGAIRLSGPTAELRRNPDIERTYLGIHRAPGAHERGT